MDKKPKLISINPLCRMLQTTSRTLRFYEEKGIITSTRSPIDKTRRYSKEQIIHIRNVMALRALELSIKAIAELQDKNADLKNAILQRRAEIFASIEEKRHEINLLNEALAIIEAGEDIFSKDLKAIEFIPENKFDEVIVDCTKAIIRGDTETLYYHLSSRLSIYMPVSAFEAVRHDVFKPLGDYVSLGSIEHDKDFSNIIYHYVKFSKLGLKIKYVFHKGKIDGLWLNYFEL